MLRILTLTRDTFSGGRLMQVKADRTWVRAVDLTTADVAGIEFVDGAGWTPKMPADRNRLLERIYRQGQNDFQPRLAPSLSMDDLIVLDDANGRAVYRVMVIGCARVAMRELTPAERLMIRFASLDLEVALDHQFEEAERAGGDPKLVERFRKLVATNA